MTEQTAQQSRQIPISEWPKFHPWPTAKGLYHLHFNRAINGADEHGVFTKIGRRVLVNEARWGEWLDAISTGAVEFRRKQWPRKPKATA